MIKLIVSVRSCWYTA